MKRGYIQHIAWNEDHLSAFQYIFVHTEITNITITITITIITITIIITTNP